MSIQQTEMGGKEICGREHSLSKDMQERSHRGCRKDEAFSISGLSGQVME